MLIVLYMALTSAWAGGSLWPSQHLDKIKMTWLPEVLFALGFAYAWLPAIGYYCIFAGMWSYIWMQTGHANALPWGAGNHNPNRTNTLSPVVKYLADKMGITYYSIGYARLFMSVKGFLITLPVGGLGFILWPLGYEIGHRTGKHVVSESASGGGAGLNVSIFMGLL